MMGIIEPILAGLSISLINKYIINNDCLSNFVMSFIRKKSIDIEKRNISKDSSSDSVDSYTGIISDINNHLIHHSILLYIIYK